MSNPAVQAAVIAASVALLVGVLTQIVAVVNQVITHRLTQRRETQKYYNEVYQKLYAPTIPHVFLYIDMVTNFRRHHDTTEEVEIEVKNRALAPFRDNILYASPKLVSIYHEIERSRFSDMSGNNPSASELRFLYAFIQEYEHVIRQSSIFSGRREGDELAPVYRRLILYLLYLNDFALIATHSWRFSKSAYSATDYKKIKAIIDELDGRRDSLALQGRFKRLQQEKAVRRLDHAEQAEVLNAQAQEDRAAQDALWGKIEEEAERKILALVVSDDRDRDEMAKMLIEARKERYR
jgi:hypothetical protein